MSSRGSKAKKGKITTDEYYTDFVTQNGIKVLKGKDNNHSLPDYAHSPNSIYAKLVSNNVFRSMRFYDSKGNPVIEIALHPESSLNKKNTPVLHYHIYNGLDRSEPKLLTNEMKEKYKLYLKEFNVYDKC